MSAADWGNRYSPYGIPLGLMQTVTVTILHYKPFPPPTF
jgi:hypothetical protein